MFIMVGPVFAVDVNSVSSLVASGGQDDRALVWSLIDGSVAFECNGKDQFIMSVFSYMHCMGDAVDIYM